MAGFGFAKRASGKDPLFLVLLSTMMIPTQAILGRSSASSTSSGSWARSGR